MKIRNGDARGFTLVELLAVIAIIAILAAVLLGLVPAAKARANSIKCLANLRQIGTAFQLYANDNNGQFPQLNQGPANGGDTMTWMIRLAPYAGVKDGVLGPYPLARAVPPFICPDWKMDSTRNVSYAVNYHIERKIFNWQYRGLNVPPSSTFLVVEIAANTDNFNPESDGDVSRRHPNKSANFLYVDGHVENIRDAVPANDPRWFWK